MRIEIRSLVFLSCLAVLILHNEGKKADARTWQDSVARTLPATATDPAMSYRYFLPAGYDPTVEYPLVLFLHGAGERGTDNTSQVQRNIGNLIEQTDANFPAILVAPQLPPGDTNWNPDRPEDRTDEILQNVLTEFSVDRDRLYITGLSLGGFGTMEYLQHYNVENPNILQFAAAAPTAAAFIPTTDVDEIGVLQQTPVWLSHGTFDTVVEPFLPRITYNLLAGIHPLNRIVFDDPGVSAGGLVDARGNARYTEYPTAGHNSWTPWYGSSELYDWMFAQTLPPTPVSLPFENSLILEAPIIDDVEFFVADDSDLLQTPGVLASTPSFSSAFQIAGAAIQNLYDGEISTDVSRGNVTESFAAGEGNFVEFLFDTTENTLGYNISSISTFAAWSTRTGQAYDVLVSLVGDPSFQSIYDFIDGLAGPYRNNVVTQVILQDENGRLLASGVDAIRFEFADNDGGWNLYREIDIIGRPTVVPEARTLGLLSFGLLTILAAGRATNRQSWAMA